MDRQSLRTTDSAGSFCSPRWVALRNAAQGSRCRRKSPLLPVVLNGKPFFKAPIQTNCFAEKRNQKPETISPFGETFLQRRRVYRGNAPAVFVLCLKNDVKRCFLFFLYAFYGIVLYLCFLKGVCNGESRTRQRAKSVA